MDNNTVVLDTPSQINAYRLMTIRQGLKAEIRGFRLTRKAPSCLSIVKKEFGIKAKTAADALPLFEEYLKSLGLLA